LRYSEILIGPSLFDSGLARPVKCDDYLAGGTAVVPGAVSALVALSSQAVYQRSKSI
jgi:hypothetical protein